MDKECIIIILLICSSLCCKGKNSEPITEIDTTVVNFYADSLVLSEEVKLSAFDSSLFANKIDSLYEIYGITREKVNTSIENYKKELSTWKSFYEMLVKRLEYLRTHE